MVRHHLRHPTSRMLMGDKPPALTFTSVYTHIDSVINRIKEVNLHVGRPLRLCRKDDATIRINPLSLHCPGKQRHDVPTLILQSHVEIQLSIRFVFCKFCKSLNRNINAFAELIPVPVKHNEEVIL